MKKAARVEVMRADKKAPANRGPRIRRSLFMKRADGRKRVVEHANEVGRAALARFFALWVFCAMGVLGHWHAARRTGAGRGAGGDGRHGARGGAGMAWMRGAMALLAFLSAAPAMAACTFTWTITSWGAPSYTISTSSSPELLACDPTTSGFYTDPFGGTDTLVNSDGSSLAVGLPPQDTLKFTPGALTQANWTFTLYDERLEPVIVNITRPAGTPVVSSVSPPGGLPAGGTTVTLTGSNFVTGASVAFGGVAGTAVNVTSPNSLVVTTPAHASGVVDVVVSTTGGVGTLTGAFTYSPLPTVTGVSPSAGPIVGGNSVTITGTNLSGATAVNFGGTAGSIQSNTGSSITATAPAGTSGIVDITVTTPTGTSTTSSADYYTYVAPPTLAVITPSNGPTSGGTSVTLAGTNFVAPLTVTVGGIAATGVVINSPTSVTLTTPAHTAGAADIAVTTPGGTATVSGAYTYIPVPTVTSVAPNSGPTPGGTSVTITGTGLSGVTQVNFGGTSASFTINSGTQITATSPAGSTGTVDITVTSTAGTSATSSGDQFTYLAAPTVSAIAPSNGTAGGGTSVMITGTNFTSGASVKFGSTSATSVTFISATTLVATSPSGSGSVDVRVTTGGGTSATSAGDVFTYVPAPTITSISPTSGSSGTDVTVTGSGFTGATSVTFGGAPATNFNVNSSTSITARAPAGTGTVDIRVTTPGGTSAVSSADQFSYVSAPTITGISPSVGPAAGGTTVTITGSNLSGVTGVKFGANNALSFSAGTSTQLTAVSPTGAAGVADVTVTTAGGTSTTGATDRFTYVGPPTAGPIPFSVAFNSAATTVPVDLSSGASAVTLVTVATAPAHGTAAVSSNTSLTYRPQAGYAGTDSFTYTLTNIGGTSTVGTVTVTVGAPTLTYSPPSTLQASVGASYSSTALAVATGGTAPYTYAIATGSLPPGLTMDANGTVRGTPTSVTVNDFTVVATDNTTPGGPYTAMSNAIRMTVSAPTIAFSSTSLASVPAGTAYNQSVTASGGVAPYSYAIIGGSLPPGVTLNTSTGAISGPLTSVGSYPFTLQAKDQNQFTAQVGLTLQVTAPTLAVDTATLPDASVGTAYTQILTASGGVQPYRLSVTGLPAGLTLTGNTISGTPTQTGAFTVAVKMTDSTTGIGAPFSVIRTLSLTVNASPMTLTPATLPTPVAGLAYSQTMTAAGGTAPYRYAVTSGTLPAGLTLNPTTGALSGTPTSTGTSNFTITATDASTGPGTPLTVAKAYAFAISSQVASAPAVQTKTLANAPVTIHATANAVGGPFSAVTIATAPSSGTAVVKGEDIVFTPAGNGNGDVTFAYTLTNAVGTSAPIAVTVTVAAVPIPVSGLQVTTGPNGETTVDLTNGASGGPFTGAAVVSMSPANAGTATIIATTATPAATSGMASAAVIAPGNGYSLRFVPAAAFAGTAVITYTLSNQNATSAPATVRISVTPRKDPSTDPDVTGLIGAQVEAARRFATTQIANYNQRLEMLHGKGRAFSSNGLNVVLPTADRERNVTRCQDATGLLSSRDACVQGGDRKALAQRKGTGTDGRGTHPGSSDARSGDADAGAGSGAGDGSGDGGEAGAPVADDDRRLAFWTAGTVDFGFANMATQRSGFRFTTGGVTLGADYRFSDQFSLGVGVGYGHDATDVGSAGTHSTGDSYSAAVYGSYRPVPTLFVDTVAGVGTLSFDSRRWVTDAAAFANGSRNGQQIFGSLSAGYEYRSDQWLFSPYGRVTASRSTLDQFSETGASWNALTYFKQNVSTVSGTLGMRAGFTKATRMGVFMPNVRVELQHDFSGQSQAGLAYADLGAGGPLYYVPGSPYGRDRVQIGLGTKLSTGSLVFGLDYNVTTGMGGLQQGVRLTFTGPF